MAKAAIAEILLRVCGNENGTQFFPTNLAMNGQKKVSLIAEMISAFKEPYYVHRSELPVLQSNSSTLLLLILFAVHANSQYALEHVPVRHKAGAER